MQKDAQHLAVHQLQIRHAVTCVKSYTVNENDTVSVPEAWHPSALTHPSLQYTSHRCAGANFEETCLAARGILHNHHAGVGVDHRRHASGSKIGGSFAVVRTRAFCAWLVAACCFRRTTGPGISWLPTPTARMWLAHRTAPSRSLDWSGKHQSRRRSGEAQLGQRHSSRNPLRSLRQPPRTRLTLRRPEMLHRHQRCGSPYQNTWQGGAHHLGPRVRHAPS